MAALSLAFGWSALYAALGTVLLRQLGRLAGWRLTARALPTVFAVLLFAFLTQTPLPDPRTLVCPDPTITPNLMPFDSLRVVAVEWRYRSSLGGFLERSVFVSVLANMALPAVIGALLGRQGSRWTTAVLFGLGLSAAVELTQLTGFWGAYPCPYRRFDVDDLMFNTLGLALGFACLRRVRYARSPASRGRPEAETSCTPARDLPDRGSLNDP